MEKKNCPSTKPTNTFLSAGIVYLELILINKINARKSVRGEKRAFVQTSALATVIACVTMELNLSAQTIMRFFVTSTLSFHITT